MGSGISTIVDEQLSTFSNPMIVSKSLYNTGNIRCTLLSCISHCIRGFLRFDTHVHALAIGPHCMHDSCPFPTWYQNPGRVSSHCRNSCLLHHAVVVSFDECRCSWVCISSSSCWNLAQNQVPTAPASPLTPSPPLDPGWCIVSPLTLVTTP